MVARLDTDSWRYLNEVPAWVSRQSVTLELHSVDPLKAELAARLVFSPACLTSGSLLMAVDRDFSDCFLGRVDDYRIHVVYVRYVDDCPRPGRKGR